MNLIRGQDVRYHCIPYVNFDNIFLMIFIARWVYLSLSKFHLRSSILSYAKTLFHRHNKLKKRTQLRIKCNRKRKIQWNLDTTNLFVRVSLAPETPFPKTPFPFPAFKRLPRRLLRPRYNERFSLPQ